jgi:ABC-type nitrate/sulfonate/bicarbonate transport system substrate-binding protein
MTRTSNRLSRLLVGAAASSLMFVTACGGGGGHTAASGGGTKSFTIASVSSGIPDLPLLAALDDMRAQGYDPKYVALNQGAEIAAQGVASGQFQMGSGADNTFELAVQSGAKMKMVVDREDVIWGLYGRGITKCDDLVGKRVAIHSQNSSSTAMVQSYLDINCPGTKPTFLVIAGSENRYSALLAGQIDASALELQDAIKLPNEPKGADIKEISDFAKDIPGLQVFSQFVNTDWAQANPQAVQDFIKALLLQHRKVNGHPEYLAQLWDKYKSNFGGLDTGTPEAFEAYSTVFPVDGGMSKESIDFSRDFFSSVGPKITLSTEQIADDSYLKKVLAEIGPA